MDDKKHNLDMFGHKKRRSLRNYIEIGFWAGGLYVTYFGLMKGPSWELFFGMVFALIGLFRLLNVFK